MLRPCAQHHHRRGTVQRGETIGLKIARGPVRQCHVLKKHAQPFPRELVIQIVRQHQILRAPAGRVGVQAAENHLERRFLLRGGSDLFLRLMDGFGRALVEGAAHIAGILHRKTAVGVIGEGHRPRTPQHGHPPVQHRILRIHNAVAAQRKQPVRLRVRGILVQNAPADRVRLVKIAAPEEMAGAVVQVFPARIAQRGQRLPRAAVLASCSGRIRAHLHRTAAHFTVKNRHADPSRFCQSKRSFSSCGPSPRSIFSQDLSPSESRPFTEQHSKKPPLCQSRGALSRQKNPLTLLQK